MKDEELAIERRLFYDGHGVGEDKNIVSLLRNVAKLCLVEHSDEDYDEILNTTLKNISAATMACDRQLEISARCDRTLRNMAIEESRIMQMQSGSTQLSSPSYDNELEGLEVGLNGEVIAQDIQTVIGRRTGLRSKLANIVNHVEVLVVACSWKIYSAMISRHCATIKLLDGQTRRTKSG